ncbi:MAG: hypothetical protein AAGI03_13505 [Pseudomonadota bacterium]
MTAHTASLINALTLIACALWAFSAIGGASYTALIPAAFGAALILCYPGVKAENKIVAHVAVLLTLVVLIALYMPLSSAVSSGATGPLVRAVLMVATTVLALVFFIKSFRDARRAREG